MSKLTRRKFIRAGSVAAVSVLSGCTLNLQRIEYLESYVDPPEEGLPGEDLWYATGCRQCPAGCGMLVRVSNGRARKAEGNPQHPVNRGKLCARGQAVLQELYDPDRLRNAVRQTGRRGSLVFEPLLWENAVYELGNELRSVLQRGGPDSVALLLGNSSNHLGAVAQRFAEAYGLTGPVFYSLGDVLDGLALLGQTSAQLFGSSVVPYYDIGRADVSFLIWCQSIRDLAFSSEPEPSLCSDASARPGEARALVQFESRLSSTAASADDWVPVKPGTEGLVALALGKLISDQTGAGRGIYDGVSVAEMAETSGVEVRRLEGLAELLTRYERPVAIAGNSLAGHQNGESAVRAVHGLNVVLERLGQPGGVYVPESVLDFPRPSVYSDVIDLIDRMAAGQVEILMIHGSNPVFELPQGSRFADALANVKLVVSLNSDCRRNSGPFGPDPAGSHQPGELGVPGGGGGRSAGGDKSAAGGAAATRYPLDRGCPAGSGAKAGDGRSPAVGQ